MAKTYVKYGLATAAGLVALTGVAFSVLQWREQKRESPHYRAGACMVCHLAVDNVGLKTEELELCTSCHEREGDVTVNGVAVDLGLSHPFGLAASLKSYPLTLPLNAGKITCQTCHDVHTDNVESHMLRLYVAKDGDADFTPLCHDCHKEY